MSTQNPQKTKATFSMLGWLMLVSLAAVTVGCGGQSSSDNGSPAASSETPSTKRVEPTAPTTGFSWNTSQIEWYNYQTGLEHAKATNKPICLVISAVWCPHCKNYSRVFENNDIVEAAKGFVMIRIDADKESDIARKYAKDGGYVPRTYFLNPDGTADLSIRAENPKFGYFYHEQNPASLLGGMRAAKTKLSR